MFVLGAEERDKEQSLKLSGVFLQFQACRYCHGGACGVFLRCMTGYQDTDPICVSGGEIPEQLGQRTREENMDILGLTQHKGGYPAEGQLATAAGFAHILPKNK